MAIKQIGGRKNGRQNEEFMHSVPLVFIGEGCSLNGLRDYLLKNLSSNPIEIVKLNTIGANESEFINCVSAIYASTKMRSIQEDEERNFVNPVGREKRETRQILKADSYDELKDEL